MARARKGGLIKTKLGFLAFGKQGSGKSTLALDFAKMKREDGKPFRVLYIDSEAGSVDTYLEDLENEGINIDNIYIVYTQSLQEVNEYVTKVKNHEEFFELDEDGSETEDIVLDADGEIFRPDAIVIDSISVLYIASQQGLTEFSKRRARVRAEKNETVGLAKTVAIEGAGLEIKDYNTLKFNGQDLVLSLLGCGVHFIIIAREQDEKTMVENEKGELKAVPTGNKIPDGYKDLAYNVKTVIHMIEDDMGNIQAQILDKDRTKVHKRNEIIENPTLLDWETVIHKNKLKKEFTLSNGLHKSVEIEKQKYEESIKDEAGMNEESESQTEKKTQGDKPSIEEYYAKIKGIVASLSPAKKKSLKPRLEKQGLTVKYQTLQTVEELEKFLEIVNQ